MNQRACCVPRRGVLPSASRKSHVPQTCSSKGQAIRRTLALAAADRIYIDSNAAGNGWFIDRTLPVNEEFTTSKVTSDLVAVDAQAVDRMDLLTVVTHELGHIAGLPDVSAVTHDLMSANLPQGIRRTPRWPNS